MLAACKAALWQGIAQAWPGRRLGDISSAVEHSVSQTGSFELIDGYTGHGIGSQMHMDPPVPNRGTAGHGPRLVPGMALAIEPMVTLGGPEVLTTSGGAIL